MTNSELLVEIASKYIGTQESDPIVSDFRKSVCGVDSKQPWCIDFIWYCLKKIKQPSQLLKTESAVGMWTHSNPNLRILRPEIGCLAIWCFNGTSKGHGGIVANVNQNTGTMTTIEGNTTSLASVDRLGDGVYRKTRHIISPPGEMQILGFLRPWLVSGVPSIKQDASS